MESGGAMFTNSQSSLYLPDLTISFDEYQTSSCLTAAPCLDWSSQIENRFNDRTGATLLKSACVDLQAADSGTELSAIIADSVRSRAGLGTLSRLFRGC